MKNTLFVFLFSIIFTQAYSQSVTASFNTPDTVCLNSPVNIQNTSTGATNYFWNFCTANINQPPIGTNLGNVGGLLKTPVYIDYVFTNGNYYGFVTNNAPGGLLRLDFGNSLLNVPAVTNLGNIGGAIANNTEGIQIANDNGNWYVLIVGGDVTAGSTPSLTTVSLGTNIANNAPTAVNWGNIGNLAYPHDLYVFNATGHWYGLTVNYSNNTVTLFDLKSSLSNTPTATNLGNIGNLSGPTGIQAINDNGNWRVFVTNALSSTLSRLDFGSSLLNIPTGVNLGNPNNSFTTCWDIFILKYCGENEAFVINANGTNDIVKLDFGNSLLNTPTAVSLGNQGSLSFPHCISKLFRVGPDVFSFITNVNNNTLTLLKFPGCTNASIPNSTVQNPPPLTYNTPGTYNINLTVDDGLPTQSSYCKQVVVQNCNGIKNIINDYTEVLDFDICKNQLTVADASKYNPGDTVLLIQMKGAVIDSSNTASFGTVTNYKNAGNYEFNYVKQKSGNTIILKNVITRQYDIPFGKVQLVRVPYYKSVSINNTLTCLPWDGSKGGVLAFNVKDTLTMNADIDVSGRGFRGGNSPNPQTSRLYCNYNEFYYPVNTQGAADKGESINEISLGFNWGKGSPSNGGGGGNGHNSGGGGGSNGGQGGLGGYQLDQCGGSAVDNRGLGGKNLLYNNNLNKIFLGGGGGSGQTDNIGGLDMNGANGGGIVIIKSTAILNNGGFIVNAKGADVSNCTLSPAINCHDGNGGGGGGGAVLLEANNIISATNINVSGGKGGDLVFYDVNLGSRIGPGGGGGAGIFWSNNSSLPLNTTVNKTGGINGVIIPDNNNPYGTTPGQPGKNIFNLAIPIDSILFKPNIDSVIIQDSSVSCANFNFKGLGYTHAFAISNWQWSFGDGTIATSKNTSHIYSSTGAYTVKLVITDINGCTDSTTKVVTANCNTSSTIINDYTEVLAFDICKNELTVANASKYNPGDTVLLIQMKGAVIDSSNTASFGTVTNYKNAGNYEFNYVKQKSGNAITLKNLVTRQYDIAAGKVQLVRAPYYKSLSTTSTLTCLPWDGSKGGVLVFNVQDTLTMNADIDVTGQGFSGGKVVNPKNNSFYCHEDGYYYPNAPLKAAPKGEGITTVSDQKIFGKGALANGGGGGLEHNSGGGGGSNTSSGGLGGKEWIQCGPPINNGGIGGKPLAYTNPANKIFLGGGGGAGHCDNVPGFNPEGGNGGGIVIINTNFLRSNSNTVVADGAGGIECFRDAQAYKCHEGMGGGGGGGSVLIAANVFLDNLKVNINGGKGADMNGEIQGELGPGGGGGAGVFWTTKSALPAAVSVTKNGGINGVNIDFGNSAYGATPGQPGQNLFNLKIPVDTILFKPNIDSVAFTSTASSCTSFTFKGQGYTNRVGITKWQWFFGDGATAASQNTSHTYSTVGSYTVKLIVTDVNGCVDSVIRNVTTNTASFDFSYTQDVCDPFTVQFFNVGAAPVNPAWSFGDGGVSNATNPVHTFTSPGNYVVKFSVQNGGCIDTVSKTISVGVVPANIILTPDTNICVGSTKQLRTVPSLSFCWTPTTYLDDPLSANPVTSAPKNIMYYFTAEVAGVNIINNGDFSKGNTSFTSQYNFANNNTTEGEYFVGKSPQAWNASLSNCGDHTSGNGNMMLINGAPIPDINVWTQTVIVMPNTNYAFSTWIQALFPPNPAQLQFSINGRDIGNLITASLPTCTWTQFYTTWNSGNNTTATISIVNKNTQIQGNDFALDDISFAPVSIQKDSVQINVNTPFIKASNDTAVCAGTKVQLATNGASSYSWTPAAGLSNAAIANPVATIGSSTSYYVTGTNSFGCQASDTVNIASLALPTITKSRDTTICNNNSVQIFATGGIKYTWSPVATLSNPNISNPVASPLSSTKYFVTVTNSNTCTNTDSVLVSIQSLPVFAISPDASVCLGITKQLQASGGDTYTWSPTTGLDNVNISNPVATPLSSTTYTVIIHENACNQTGMLSTTITSLSLPNVQATSSNDITCSVGSSQLNATGASAYIWFPATNLNNANIPNPVAKPLSTTTFTVTGKDVNGCSNADTVIVKADFAMNSLYLMPNSFTPNGDGINDCFGIKNWGAVQELDFSIYNRYGERVFYTTDATACWDGKYKQHLQDANVFVYIIKAKTVCGLIDRKGVVALIK